MVDEYIVCGESRRRPDVRAIYDGKPIAIEIQLTSNDVILGVKGGDHPISLYKAAGVPIVTETTGALALSMQVSAAFSIGFAQ